MLSFILFIVTVYYHHMNCIEVFKTTEDFLGFLESGSAITINNPPNISLTESTTCFRFWNYFVATEQLLLSFRGGSLAVGTSWSKHNSLGMYGVPWHENLDIVTGLFWRISDGKNGVQTQYFDITEWPLQIWNSLCFMMSFVKSMFIFSPMCC